jgi:hypothetical protein
MAAMNQKTFLQTLVLALALLGPRVEADIITLRSGEQIEGKVLEVTRNEVKFETKVHNIRTTVSYRRAQVANIEYRELPADFWDSGRVETPAAAPSAPAETDPPADTDPDAAPDDEAVEEPTRRGRRIPPESQYVVVPVKGTIGEEVTAHGLRTALLQTRGRGIKHVVFTVDSPGGYVFEAVQILEALKEFDADLTYHCVIENGAISAASVFAAGADSIYVRPGARLGGAVAYTSDNSTGATEVDAKFNSIWSAEVASRAESKGHNGDAFRAMIVVASELWQSDADGSFSARSRGGQDTQIDGPSTVLTISAAQMVKGGMARMVETPIEDMGSLTGVEDWTELKSIGHRAMMTAARERAELKRRFDAALEDFQRAGEQYDLNHPSKVQYTIERSATGLLTMESRSLREWQARTDATVRACNTMLASLKELATINTRAEKTGAQHLLIPAKLGHDRYVEIDTERNKLLTQRNRPPVAEMVRP